MTNRTPAAPLVIGLGALASVALSIPGCGSTGGLEPLRPPPEAAGQPLNTRPALLIEGRAISRDEVWPLLAEYGGADIVMEIVLDHAIAAELARAGLTVTEADIDAERGRLTSRLATGVTDEEAAEISRLVLESRGLGPGRLRGLLTRNAGLRKLVAEDAEPLPETVELAHRVRFGPRREARIITTATAASAQSIVNRIQRRADEVGLLAAFAETATSASTDRTAPQGGSLGAISPQDPGLPVAVRSVLAQTEPMTISPIVAMDSGFAVLLIERDVPAEAVTLESVYAELEADVRERQQRLSMETRARSLVDEYAPSVLDASLRWSWDRRGELTPP